MKAIPAAMYKSSQDLLSGVFSEAIRDSDTRAPMMAVGFCWWGAQDTDGGGEKLPEVVRQLMVELDRKRHRQQKDAKKDMTANT